MIIEDPATGINARVDNNQRLQVSSKSRPLQHVISEEDEQAYQTVNTSPAVSGTQVVQHFQNNSTTLNAIVTYFRMQNITLAGGTALPNALNYFSIALGRTYVSGGTATTPVNVFSGSSNVADVTVYNSNGTPVVLAGTALEIDRWYPITDGDEQSFRKEGSIIVPAGQTLEISYVGDHTSGTLYTRMSFFMDDKDF
jgi:hypothetical protein